MKEEHGTGALPASDFPPSSDGADARRRERVTWSLLFFIGLSLLALAVVPFGLNRYATRMEDVIPSVYEPTQRRAWRFHVANVQGFARLQAALRTQSPAERRRLVTQFQSARSSADSIYADLEDLVHNRLPELMGEGDLQLEEALADLWTAADDWYLAHDPVLTTGLSETSPNTTSSNGRDDYDRILTASQTLHDLLDSRIDAVRANASELEELQRRIALAVVIAALIAIIAVARVAARLRSLARQADRRKRDAVEARREADAVLQGTADGVIGVDLSGRCTFLNRAAADMLGRTPRDALGQDLHALAFHTKPGGELYAREESPLLRALDTGDMSFSEDAIVWRRDGTSFPAQVSCRPMIDGREVRGAVLSIVDLTEVRRVESKLRKAVRARDEVVGVVSHDLRNPVGTIYIAADLLLDVPLPEEKRRDQLQVIKRQAKHMEGLIRDLLDITRIEAGTLPVHPQPHTVESIVEDALSQARALADRKGIEVDKRLDPLLPLVQADRNRILQVFSNLVGNAIKFTPSGGRVTITGEATDDGVVLRVTDTGDGIDESDLEHVFDRFWHVQHERSAGAGLGLAIVKGIVEAHEGRVWVESARGEGARFSFTLPAVGHSAGGLEPLFAHDPGGTVQ